MVAGDPLGGAVQGGDALQDATGEAGVAAHALHFLHGEQAGLGEDAVGHAQGADVVPERGEADELDAHGIHAQGGGDGAGVVGDPAAAPGDVAGLDIDDVGDGLAEGDQQVRAGDDAGGRRLVDDGLGNFAVVQAEPEAVVGGDIAEGRGDLRLECRAGPTGDVGAGAGPHGERVGDLGDDRVEEVGGAEQPGQHGDLFPRALAGAATAVPVLVTGGDRLADALGEPGALEEVAAGAEVGIAEELRLLALIQGELTAGLGAGDADAGRGAGDGGDGGVGGGGAEDHVLIDDRLEADAHRGQRDADIVQHAGVEGGAAQLLTQVHLFGEARGDVGHPRGVAWVAPLGGVEAK